MNSRLPITVSMLAFGLAFVAGPAAASGEPSLYERLGGEPVVARIAEQTLRTVATNPATNQSFEGINVSKLAPKIASHLCALTGGGCAGTSDSIKTVHAGLHIGEREFYSLVEALRVALDANGVGEREKNELLRILAPMKRDVVSR